MKEKEKQEGIQNELITSLTNSEELKVRQTESINNLIQSKDLNNYASITPSIASNISQKLDANIFIYGSIKQVGNTIRINAQLSDRNIIGGLELVDKVLELRPDAINSLHCKGWGLYKQGKYKEALDVLQKSWDLRRLYAIYNHEAWLHLEAAKKLLPDRRIIKQTNLFEVTTIISGLAKK